MKSRSISVMIAAAAALAVTIGVAGCSSGSGAGGKTTLEFQTAQSIDSPLYAALKKATAQFEKQNPGIDVDLKTGGNDYEAQMKVRLAANNPPDLWATHGWSLLRYSQFLAPLNKESWAKNFNEVLAPAMKNDDGQFFALPVTTAASGLILNSTVLADAGVDPASITSWDALTTAADAVKKKGITPFYLAGSKDGSAGNVIDWLAPGAFSDSQLSKMKDGEFQSAAYGKLLGVVDSMRKDGWTNVDYTSATGDDMARALAQGKSAFALSSNSLINSAWKYAPDAALTYIPVPPVDGGKPYLIGGEDTAFGASKSGAHLADAKKYLAFLAKPANITALAKSVGNPPGLTDATADLGPLTAPFDEYVKSGAVELKPFFDRVYLPNGMWDSVVTTADSVVAGQSTPTQGAEKVASDFSTLYKKTSN